MADRTEIIKSLQRILDPGQVTELRALGVVTPAYRRPHIVSGYFDNVERLADEAVRLETAAKGIYFIPNPVNPALLARSVNKTRDISDTEPLTSDRDILTRRWFLIDIDPIRPAGISSSQAEHDAALAAATEIKEMLAADGWPTPLMGDSGNGAHLLYRVDLPIEDEGLLKSCLEALAFRFDDQVVSIDQKVFNPARIWKLYGTIARKGENTPDRPHRCSKLLVDDDVPWI